MYRLQIKLGWVPLVAALACCGVHASGQERPISENGPDLSRYPAVVAPSRMVLLRAEVPGRLLTAEMPKEGQAFKQGQIVARMDDREQLAAVTFMTLSAKSSFAVKRAKAVIEEQAIQVERAQDMVNRNAGTESELRQAKVQLELAKLDLENAVEQQSLAEIRKSIEEARLEQMRLRAPFDGRVTRIESRDGGTVSQGDAVAEFVSLDPLRVDLPLPVGLYGQMKVGESFRLNASEPVDREVVGRVDYIDPMIDSASKTFRVVMSIDNPDQQMPAGFVVTLAGLEPVPEAAEKPHDGSPDDPEAAGDPLIEDSLTVSTQPGASHE